MQRKETGSSVKVVIATKFEERALVKALFVNACITNPQ
jgi:hypothetical protein